MALIIEIKVNDRVIARAVAGNVTNLADTSDYIVRGLLFPSKFNDGKTLHYKGDVKNHDRNTPVWHLVRKMMDVIIDDPKPSDVTDGLFPVIKPNESYSRAKLGADLILENG